MNKYPIEKNILEAFVREIIKEKSKRYFRFNSLYEHPLSAKEEKLTNLIITNEKIQQKESKQEITDIKKDKEEIKPLQKIRPPSQIQVVGYPLPQRSNIRVIEQPQKPSYPQRTVIPVAPKPQIQITPPAPREHINVTALSKLNQFLSDPAVQSVECPSPGKQILVNKAGAIQTTNVTISSEEIDLIMKEISEKTKIPLTPGVFKAALGEFLITAILSEFVGTRFVIQKRH